MAGTAPWDSCHEADLRCPAGRPAEGTLSVIGASLMALNETGVHHGIHCQPCSSRAVEQGQDRWPESAVHDQGDLGAPCAPADGWAWRASLLSSTSASTASCVAVILSPSGYETSATASKSHRALSSDARGGAEVDQASGAEVRGLPLPKSNSRITAPANTAVRSNCRWLGQGSWT